ncbi:MAG: HepT-like ribonuclease domain-containing protein [Clostridium sp.]
MRNRLVHEYDKIQDRIVFDSIKRVIEMVNMYIDYINKH